MMFVKKLSVAMISLNKIKRALITLALAFMLGNAQALKKNTPFSCERGDDGWLGLKGCPSPDSIYFGMITTHLVVGDNGFIDLENNNIIGLSYNGIFFARVNNTYKNATHVFGLQRNFYSKKILNTDFFNLTLGYRAAFVHGYDERLIWLAKYSSVLPFVGMIANINFGSLVGVELSWSWQVFSIASYIRI